jgi:hypothetical protein
MNVTISLNRVEAGRAARGEKTVDLEAVLRATSDVTVLKVFGRGRFAQIVAGSNGFKEVKSRLGDFCVFSTKAVAQPF